MSIIQKLLALEGMCEKASQASEEIWEENSAKTDFIYRLWFLLCGGSLRKWCDVHLRVLLTRSKFKYSIEIDASSGEIKFS